MRGEAKSRGGLRGEAKVATATKKFHYDFRGKVVMDIGSSTGGFTDLALKAGAARVIAIEKGTKQMQEPMRSDERVELHEKTDVFDVRDFDVDTIMIDVSFLSIKKVLKHIKNIFRRECVDILALVKPQFEARPEELNNGIVKNNKIRREIFREFEDFLRKNNFLIIDKTEDIQKGKHGNQERFYFLRLYGEKTIA